MQNLVYAAPVAGVLALIFAWMKASWVSQQDAGEANMVEIAGRIQEGALAFLRALELSGSVGGDSGSGKYR